MLAKHELLKVPLIGWTWYFLEIVFCKRRWEDDRKTVFTGLERLKDYPECMWVSESQTHHASTGVHRPFHEASLQRHTQGQKQHSGLWPALSISLFKYLSPELINAPADSAAVFETYQQERSCLLFPGKLRELV